eukprot:TRINITY_DN97693_c0_g1_i1.p1 TRINITY_DN97693_c0_g1~~TRINITY_DN97693_c0_g1_i1.p1  ORF type:complete len:246 (-),score=38.60 TRINITY_DN97693_c0_g1_i1:48-785(-)
MAVQVHDVIITPPVRRFIDAIFDSEDVTNRIACYLSFSDLACGTQSVSHTLEASTRSRLEVFKQLLQAPFQLTHRDMLHSTYPDFAGRGINDTSLQVLAEALLMGALSKVIILALSGNRISDDGLRNLSNSIQNGALTRLRELWLGHNEIGTVGVQALSEACAVGGLPACQAIQLHMNPRIEGDGISVLALSIKEGVLPVLQTIVVDGRHMQHTQLAAACRSRGIKISRQCSGPLRTRAEALTSC